MNQFINNNNHQIETDNNICKANSIEMINNNHSLVSPSDGQHQQKPIANNIPIEIIESDNDNLLNSNNIVINSFGNKNDNNVEVVTDKPIVANGTSGISTDHNPNQNDSPKLLSNNPKKYGKFRILHNNNYTLTNNDHNLNDNNNNNSNGINDNNENFSCLNGGTTTSVQAKIQMNGSLETETVNASNEIDVLESNQKISSSTSSTVNLDNAQESVETTSKRGRGKPKKQTTATKKTKSDLPTNNAETRRRSNRLLKLEKSNNEVEENLDDSSQRQLDKNSDSISNDKFNNNNNNSNNNNNNNNNESDISNCNSGKDSQQKNKSINDKNKSKIKKSKEKKKDKNKKIKDKSTKHKSKLSKSSSNKNKKSDKTNSDKDKSDNHVKFSSSSLSSTKENITLPQEPLSSTKESATNNDMLITDESSKNTEKVKSRWRKDSELDNTTTVSSSSTTTNSSSITCSSPLNKLGEKNDSIKNHNQVLQDCTNNISNNNNNEPLPNYITIDDNIFLFEKKKSKTKKETKKMVCDCILTKEERAKGLMGCGDDCLNRMLMIECGSRCPLGEHCSNKRFQNKQHLKVEPFKTEKKGWGLMAMEPIPEDTFIMEYVGEVIDPFMFHKRVEKYSKSKFRHHYFMALKSDEIIDATNKGNVTRFINHSCEPNAMTQKWTVNGELRIGFFSMKPIQAGEEITFDYQFQRYGKKAQKCFCETKSCRGFIGTSENANILTDGSKIPKKPSKADDASEEEDDNNDDDNMEEEFLEDIALEEEIDLLAENGGLRNRQQILVVSRLMLRADKCELRIQLIDIIMSTIELAYLRLFLDYHGLQIIWGWMVEAEDVDLKARLLELLEILPIPNKTMLVDSKVYQVVERWAAPDSLESQQFLHINDDVNNSCNKDGKDDKDKNTKIDIKEEIKEEKDDKRLDNTEDNLEVEDSETTTTSNNTVEKKTSADHLAKLSGKIVIKTKSKTQSTTNENGSSNGTTASIGTPNKSNVTIGFLAQKLLTHWKDLKEVFRIPRLEREKRRTDEAEADRRTQEDEERRSKGLPPMFHDDENKSLFSNKDYAIAGILGKNRNRNLIRNFAEKRGGMFRKRSSSSFSTNNNNNNINDNHNFLITNNSNPSQQNPTIKISKEEHRKRFELNVVHSDYSEMLKKYEEQLSLYNSHIAQQTQLFLASTLPHNQNNAVDNSAIPAQIGGLNEFYRQYLNELANSNTNSNNLLTSSPYLTAAINNNHPFIMDPRLSSSNLHQVASYSLDMKNNNNDIQSTSLSMSKQHSNLKNNLDETANYMDSDMDVDFKDLIPPYQSPLVVLFEDSYFQSQNNNNSSTISPQAIDNVDFSQIKFESDNCIESMEKKMFDELYPPAGIFYVTQKGATYFVSLPSDPTQEIIVKENLTEPLPLSFTKRKPDDRLLSGNNWKYSMIDGHYFYHNKQKQIKQWHPPTDTQLDNYCHINTDDQAMDSLLCDINVDVSTSSTPSVSYGNGIASNSHHKRKNDNYRKKKLIEEKFRNKISQFVVKCLNPYMKSSCQTARITNSEDFKNLARKLTHTIVGKEIKQCKKIEDLSYTESVKYKTKEYVKRYMSRFGSVYSMRESSREKSQSPTI